MLGQGGEVRGAPGNWEEKNEAQEGPHVMEASLLYTAFLRAQNQS